jgi:hypothetical protein
MEDIKMKKILIVLIVLISTQYIVIDQLNAEFSSSKDQFSSQNEAYSCVIEYRKIMEMDAESEELAKYLEAWSEQCSPIIPPVDPDPTRQPASKRIAVMGRK